MVCLMHDGDQAATVPPIRVLQGLNDYSILVLALRSI